MYIVDTFEYTLQRHRILHIYSIYLFEGSISESFAQVELQASTCLPGLGPHTAGGAKLSRCKFTWIRMWASEFEKESGNNFTDMSVAGGRVYIYMYICVHI